MILIATTTVGAGGSQVTFSSIPATYTDLMLVVSGRGSRSSYIDDLLIRFNGDTGTNYTSRVLYGQGSSAGSLNFSLSYGVAGYVPAATATANTFGNAVMYIPNYAGSTVKSFTTDSVTENNATSANQEIAAGLWNSTAAINTLFLFLGFTVFDQNTTVSLYGIQKDNGYATVS